MAEKPKIHTTYHFIDLYDDWSDYDYVEKENQMEQHRQIQLRTRNWDYDFASLESRTYEILHALTTLSDEETARVMVRHERRVNP